MINDILFYWIKSRERRLKFKSVIFNLQKVPILKYNDYLQKRDLNNN